VEEHTRKELIHQQNQYRDITRREKNKQGLCKTWPQVNCLSIEIYGEPDRFNRISREQSSGAKYKPLLIDGAFHE
jgi:hypothetical protein